MKERSRIVHFVDIYLQHTETFIYNFIIKSAEKFDITIITFSIQNIVFFPLPANVTIILLPPLAHKRRSVSGLSKYLYDIISGKPMWSRSMRKEITKINPLLVHCHFGPIGILFAQFLKLYSLKFKYAVSFYGYDASLLPKKSIVYRNKLVLIWRSASVIFAEGPVMKDRIIKLGASESKIHLNPIIINQKQYPNFNKIRFKGKSELIRFLLIGRYREKKGFHLFLEAIGRIKKSVGKFSITLVGDGPMKKVYDEIIKKYELENHVHFHGLIPLEQCISLMLEHDAFVHPSLTASDDDSEGGAPTVLLEAQYVGIPIIASTHADIPYIMGYKNFLAKENDMNDLIQIIRKFINTDPYELNNITSLGRENILRNHTFSLNVYNKLLEHFSYSDH
jgi:colanic acid/amylovoran biosynthesis glycosyltransferase